MARNHLVFQAGRTAFDSIRSEGFAPDRIGTIVGASGGAKWLVLSQIDRVIATSLLPRLRGPVHLIGTSIGAWRFACYAQQDPVAAIERFEAAYILQSYSDRPGMAEISAKSREILGNLLGSNGVAEILDHPVLRTHIMAVRARHVAAIDQSTVLAVVLFLAAAANAVSRRALALFFERALFFDARDLPPFFDVGGFPLQKIRIGRDNLEDAILATGAIPLVLEGVSNIARARPGVYRDGGVIDYHLDLPQSENGRLALYPHFFERVVPGWFDKRWRWRRPDPAHLESTIVVSPSAEFVAGLPHGKIPDRFDFRSFEPAERIRIWRTVVNECQMLADEFATVLENDQLASRLMPL